MTIENVYVANRFRSMAKDFVVFGIRLLPKRLKRGLRWWLAHDFQSLTFAQISGQVLEIKRGIFQGVSLDRASLSLPMIIGSWEKLVHDFIQLQSPYDLVIDIGAADGIYPIGMLKNGMCSRAIAYEALESSRRRIAENARLNNVEVEVRGYLSDSESEELLIEISKSSEHALVIVDVEGFEFELITPHFAKSAAEVGADVIVELHGDKMQNDSLVGMLKQFFDVRLVTQDLGRLDPEIAHQLSIASEMDWMDCVMEGRQIVQSWALCSPK